MPTVKARHAGGSPGQNPKGLEKQLAGLPGMNMEALLPFFMRYISDPISKDLVRDYNKVFVICNEGRIVKIAIISGARPQFIKIAPLLIAFKNYGINYYHIHSGQHYDKAMSDQIFSDLEMDTPEVNLEVGSASHGKQTGKMTELIEKELNYNKPDYTLVVGDTNSTLAGALASIKLQIPVIHLEAGLRSHDWKMPEEINRIMVDRISSLLITSSDIAVSNLKAEGIKEEAIFRTGDIMVDTLINSIEKVKTQMTRYNFDYLLVTVHRQENVDIKENCAQLIQLFKKSPLPLVFPIHPRAKKRFDEFGLLEELSSIEHVHLIDPVGYLEFLKLQYNSKGILTDSGGLQKEAFIMKTPCITLRTTTEWIETIEMGANKLLGLDIDIILDAINQIDTGKFVVKAEHPYGDGKAAEQITQTILDRHKDGKITLTSPINY